MIRHFFFLLLFCTQGNSTSYLCCEVQGTSIAINVAKHAVLKYQMEFGKIPSQSEGLNFLVEKNFLHQIPKDLYGKKLVYLVNDNFENGFLIVSESHYDYLKEHNQHKHGEYQIFLYATLILFVFFVLWIIFRKKISR